MDLSKVEAVIDVRIWIRKFSVIEKIEKFGAQFKCDAFTGERYLFRDGHICVKSGGAAEKIAWQSAVGSLRRIGDCLSIARKHVWTAHAVKCRETITLSIRKTGWIKPVVPGIALKCIGMARIEYVDRASKISPYQIGITGRRRSSAGEIEIRKQVREHVDGETRSPVDDWIEAPTFGQSLRQRRHVVIERQVPAAAEYDAMPHIEVRRSVELVRVVERDLRIPVLKARCIVNAVRKSVGEIEIGAAKTRASRELFP